MKKIRILVVGLGTMGISHARAYQAIEEFELVGLCTNRPETRHDLTTEFKSVPLFADFDNALETLKPDAVSICTYTETHADYCKKALNAGAHVFCEKPLAHRIEDAQAVIELAKQTGRALIIGYILRVHPSWTRFVELGQTLGKPLVMRMNLNQQSSGSFWDVHKRLMASTSPIVDCGVHYVDVMCQVTRSKPISVHAIGARLTNEIPETMYNYGHLHLTFEDGSVGFYEAGWGPMISETAFFIKDMIGPKGCVSIVGSSDHDSQDHDGHTKTGSIKLHHSSLNSAGEFSKADEHFPMANEPGHQDLCEAEQRLFLDAIVSGRDLSEHHEDALNSLRIVFAADESVKTGKVVYL